MRLIFKLMVIITLIPLLWTCPAFFGGGIGGEVSAQNLVPNYSFEDTIPLNLNNPPYLIYGVDVAAPWFMGYNDQTPDYFSASYYNSISFGYHTPQSWWGYQFPKSGVAYIGIAVSSIWNNNDREFASVRLNSALLQNHKYYVEFFVSLADTSILAVNRMGALLTIDTPDFLNGPFGFQPQIENPVNSILSDTQTWTPINGYYLANGGEEYLTIGNFYQLSNMDTLIFNYPAYPVSYYFIDDVSVIDCTSTTINEVSLQSEINLYPIPVRDKLTISVNDKYSINEIFIESTDGKTIIHQKQKHQKQKVILDVAMLPSSTYIVRVVLNNGQVVRKVVKL